MKDLSNKHILNLSKDWQKFQAELIKIFGNATFENWFAKLEIHELSDHSITFSVPNRFIKEWVAVNYIDQLNDILKNFFVGIFDVDFFVNESEANQPAIAVSENDITKIKNLVTEKKNVNDNFEHIGSILDPKFNFANFVVAEENKIAFTAAQALIKKMDAISSFQTLYVHGGVGFGKTHLLQAIAHALPNDKVIYLSAERFMYHYIKSIRENKLFNFKEYFNDANYLLLDDFHFIEGKSSTQNELLNIIDTISNSGCKIIFASSCQAANLKNINPAIASRITGGMITEIFKPAFETRIQILRKKSIVNSIYLDDEVIHKIAATLKNSPRELDGVLNKISVYKTVFNQDVTIENIDDIIADFLPKRTSVEVNIELILKIVAKFYDLKPALIKGKSRVKNIALARQITMYLAKELTIESLVAIGKYLGGRDHTTVIHAHKKIASMLKTDAALKLDLDKIQESL